MEIISFNEAATANGRIEKFIKNPDSNSGIVTVPKVIEAGESVTVPAGRVAVLPNVQVDGTLNVEGEVFIPSGSGLSTVVQKSGDTMSGNLNFASGTKITGDFNNATIANRTLFQTSTANSNTGVFFIPNTLLGSAAVRVTNSNDTVNFNSLEINANPSTTSIISNFAGTASALPLVFATGGAERMRIDTSGNVLVTGSSGLGYGAGAGGTVTQLTSKSTAVTLNKPCGKITMHNASLAAGTEIYFTLYNSVIGINDVVYCMTNVAVNGWTYRIRTVGINSGLVNIYVKNEYGAALADSIDIYFVVIKGAIA